MRNKFSVEFVNSFYTSVIYDARGRECFDVVSAADAAEDLYGDGWSCVYNGEDSITREDYLSACARASARADAALST